VHNHGINPDCYTYKRRPVKLMFVQGFSNPNDAIAAEKKIKGWSKKKKEALFEGEWNKIHELAKCKNMTSHVYYKKSSFDSAKDDMPLTLFRMKKRVSRLVLPKIQYIHANLRRKKYGNKPEHSVSVVEFS